MARQPVYSTLFVAAQAGDISAEYVVPAGHIAVVRDVVALFIGAPEDTAGGVLDATTSTWIAYHLQTETTEYWQWQGRQVVAEGATIQGISTGSNTVSLRCSGYLLGLP